MSFKKLKDVMESLTLGHTHGRSMSPGLPSSDYRRGLEAGRSDSRAGNVYDDSDESPAYQKGYEKGFDSEDDDDPKGPENRQNEGFYDNLDDDGEGKDCPDCGGPMYVLGTLGNLTHWRCRNCGSVSDEPAKK